MVKLEATKDKGRWILRVGKSCQFVYRGREPNGFYQGGSWEVRKVNGIWSMVGGLEMVIT